jgi:hypothetical protein
MRRRDALPDPAVERALHELEAALAAEPTADPDLALLVADVDSVRPEPSAAFLASLDARVHAGFPREEETPRRKATTVPWHVRLRRPQVLAPAFGLAVAAVVAVLVVSSRDTMIEDSGSFASSGSASTSSVKPLAESADSAATVTGARPATATPSSGRATSAAGSSSASTSSGATAKSTPSAPAPSVSAPAPERKVQRAAELTLAPKPDDVQDTADGVIRETQAAGGYVQQSDVSTRDGAGEATFTLRIPSAKLDATLARLSKLAHVGALDQTATDITAQTVSAADQLSDARDQRRALLKALGRATTERQIASLKARLRDNRSEIAARKGALDAQRRRADLATIAVSVEGTRAPAGKTEDDGGGAWTPGDALHDAGRVLEVAAGVALIALAVLVPLGILAALGLLGGRTLRRHRRETALDRAA